MGRLYMVGKGWWYSWIFVDGHRLPMEISSRNKETLLFSRAWIIMDLPGKIGGVASPGAQRCLERPGCGRERARSSQSESTRRPEAVELRTTQSNP